MNDCCLAVIDRYREIWGGCAEGAALFCPQCESRLVFCEGVWGVAQ